MSRILKTSRAELDLVEIGVYIARHNPAAAERLLDRFDEICRMLARQPLIGEIRDELEPELRSFPVGNYVIYYRPMPDGVCVFRVLHGARDVTELF
jgi:toxin ParE1/3/4